MVVPAIDPICIHHSGLLGSARPVTSAGIACSVTEPHR